MNNEIKFLNIEWRSSYPLTNFEKIKSIILYNPISYVWFPVHLYTGEHPNSSGQLAELIVHIIPLE